MKVALPLTSFSSFKVICGAMLLLSALLFPLISYVAIVILIVGKAHSLGAWMAIWRAGKFTWPYFLAVASITGFVSWWGSLIAPLEVLMFASYALFAFHFLFDEFDLQGALRDASNLLSAAAPTFLSFSVIFDHFFDLGLPLSLYFIITLMLVALEFIFLREIHWFFVQTKVLTLFVLAAISLGQNAIMVINMFLMYHYFFWFIYPVYKLHTHKREERDGMIMMLLVIMVMSVFIYSTKIWGAPELVEVALRTFFIASIAHILTTAPFGYLVGLPRPLHHAHPSQ